MSTAGPVVVAHGGEVCHTHVDSATPVHCRADVVVMPKARSPVSAKLIDSSTAMNVHLVVPELFPDPERGSATLPELRADALELLLARGRYRSGPGASLEAWLLEAFTVARQEDWPAAPYSLVGDGGDPSGTWWLRADPVNLQVAQDTVLMSDATLLDVANDEATTLAAHLSEHFATAGISFHPLRSDRWYARVDRDPGMNVPPIAEARGQPLTERMPEGPERRRWRSVLNDIQMLLHDHPVNVAREARGAPVINGLWLWGAGRIAGTPRTPYRRVTSDNPLARGLMLAAGKRHDPLPPTAREWLNGSGQSGVEAIVLEALRTPAAYGDMSAWQAAVEALERDWFTPLLGALRAGRIGMITLHSPAVARTREAETTRQDLRHFWRKRRRLAAYAA